MKSKRCCILKGDIFLYCDDNIIYILFWKLSITFGLSAIDFRLIHLIHNQRYKNDIRIFIREFYVLEINIRLW